MLRPTPIVLCALFGVLMLVGGCSTPNYSTTTAEQCSDGKVSGDETDVDCGGSCMPCDINKSCKVDADCSSSTCIDKKCYKPSCRDGKQDNDESDIDCGGGTCPACKDSYKCNSSSDCVDSNPCIAGVCFSAGCSNGKQDGTETGLDCGGNRCPPCAALQGCQQSSDCMTGNSCFDNLSRAVIDVTAATDCGDAGACAHKGTCYGDSCKNGSLDDPETDIDCGGGVCPGCATFKKCLQNSDCASGNLCIAGVCYVSTCANNALDGKETDKDCGGSVCPPCVKGKTCNQASDCVASSPDTSTPCTNNKCGDPTCFNKVQDQGETAVDCGGSNCPPCDIGATCKDPDDCSSLNCDNGTCATPSCTDSRKNGGETGLNCGDPEGKCKRCGTGEGCTGDGSCASSSCDVVNKVCLAPSCIDKRMNGDETGTDCGGSCAAQSPALRCDPGVGCGSDSDCSSYQCLIDANTNKGACQAPSCTDKVQNGDETDVNCGGSCAKASATGQCQLGKKCKADGDCVTGLQCLDSQCATPLCKDKTLDNNETDIDCGGPCTGCADGMKCQVGSDCANLVCTGGTCAVPSCADGVQNGNETDLNCGGGSCGKCADTEKCKVDADCLSARCINQTCAVPTCTDGVQNGQELSTDCAGGCPITPTKNNPSCGQDTPCASDADCSSPHVCGVLHSLCSLPTCSDSRIDQDETDIDCGGTCACPNNSCPPGMTKPQLCADKQKCLANSDCASQVCSSCNTSTNKCSGSVGTCTPASCPDNKQNGGETDVDCGGPNCATKCPDNAGCAKGSDCVSGVCKANICQVPTCSDGVVNGTETDVISTDPPAECGGSCQQCPSNKKCNLDSDCQNGSCPKGLSLCVIPSCKNGQQDPGETDKDCGGSNCPACGGGLHCTQDSDCISKACDTTSATPTCATPSCADNAIDNLETDLNCGGGGTNPCPACGDGKNCVVNTDCQSAVCDNTSHCATATCSDGVKNSGEYDTDCLGTECTTKLCQVGQNCRTSADCASAFCTPDKKKCATPTCSDTYQNQDETDLNCGGKACATRCAAGQKCLANSDCLTSSNNWCKDGTCVSTAPVCTDGYKNGSETGKDCGGSCASNCAANYYSSCSQCADGGGCTTALDCKSLTCINNTCATPTNCLAKVLDGLGPSGCLVCNTGNPSDKPNCMAYLLCYFTKNCNPKTGKDANGADCTSATAVCGVNAIGGGTAPQTAANTTYSCACP